MRVNLAAFFGKDRLVLCIGFGLLWSMTKGMMNTDVFAYPESEFDFDLVFLVYLFLSFAAALVIALRTSLINRALRCNPWLLSALFALGITVLASQNHLWPKLLSCAVCAITLSILLLRWIRVFTFRRIDGLIIDIPLSFAAGNIFAWVYTIVGNDVSFYLYVMIPFISSALYLYLPRVRDGEKQVCSDDVALITILRKRFPQYRFLLASFLRFFSVSLISIAVSYLCLTKASISGSQQVFIHLLAPTLGALIALFAHATLKSRVNLLLLVLMPIMATMLFLLPLFGYGYVLLVKGLSMALVEYLIIMSLYLTMEAAGEHHHDAVALAAALLSLLGLSTLLGILSGLLFSFVGVDDGSLLWIMGAFSLYLLFMAFLVLVPVWKKDGGGTQNVPVALALASNERVLDAVCGRFQLSRREKDVLGYLAAGRSSKYIASSLVLSEETVKGHIKKIYHKMNIHSKQELLDIVQDFMLREPPSTAVEKTPLKKG